MISRAFLLINVQTDDRLTEYAHPAEELRAVPGVKRVEEVQGIYDFLVEIETSNRITQVADNIMAKLWLKRMYILRPLETYHPASCNCCRTNTVNESKI